MASATCLHTFSVSHALVPAHLPRSTLTDIFHRFTPSGRLFSHANGTSLPSLAPVHAQAKRGSAFKDDDVASRKHAPALLSIFAHLFNLLVLNVARYFERKTWELLILRYSAFLVFRWLSSLWSAAQNSGISRAYTESEEQANRLVRWKFEGARPRNVRRNVQVSFSYLYCLET